MAININQGFRVSAREPIDARLVHAGEPWTNTDIVSTAGVSGSHIAYEGLIAVDTTNDRVYILTDLSQVAVEAGWAELIDHIGGVSSVVGGTGATVVTASGVATVSVDYGTAAGTALEGNTRVITAAEIAAIVANSAKATLHKFTGTQSADADVLASFKAAFDTAGTASNGITVPVGTALVTGDTIQLTNGGSPAGIASYIYVGADVTSDAAVTNTVATADLVRIDGLGITSVQAADIVTNNAKVGLTFGSAADTVATWAEGDDTTLIPSAKLPNLAISNTHTYTSTETTDASTLTSYVSAFNEAGVAAGGITVPVGEQLSVGDVVILTTAAPVTTEVYIYTGVTQTSTATSATGTISAANLVDFTNANAGVTTLTVGAGLASAGGTGAQTGAVDVSLSTATQNLIDSKSTVHAFSSTDNDHDDALASFVGAFNQPGTADGGITITAGTRLNFGDLLILQNAGPGSTFREYTYVGTDTTSAVGTAGDISAIFFPVLTYSLPAATGSTLGGITGSPTITRGAADAVAINAAGQLDITIATASGGGDSPEAIEFGGSLATISRTYASTVADFVIPNLTVAHNVGFTYDIVAADSTLPTGITITAVNNTPSDASFTLNIPTAFQTAGNVGTHAFSLALDVNAIGDSDPADRVIVSGIIDLSAFSAALLPMKAGIITDATMTATLAAALPDVIAANTVGSLVTPSNVNITNGSTFLAPAFSFFLVDNAASQEISILEQAGIVDAANVQSNVTATGGGTYRVYRLGEPASVAAPNAVFNYSLSYE